MNVFPFIRTLYHTDPVCVGGVSLAVVHGEGAGPAPEPVPLRSKLLPTDNGQ